MKGAIFLIIALAVSLAAVGATTALMSIAAPAYAKSEGECHTNQGSEACTGPGGGFVCNKGHDGCFFNGKP